MATWLIYVSQALHQEQAQALLAAGCDDVSELGMGSLRASAQRNTQKTAKNAKHRLIHYLLRRMELVHAAVELSAALFVRVENTFG